MRIRITHGAELRILVPPELARRRAMSALLLSGVGWVLLALLWRYLG